MSTMEGAERAGVARGRLRIALYSHDACGLGHVRRNLAVANALGALEPTPDVLVVTGLPMAAAELPAHVDVVAIPAVAKLGAGDYRARHRSVSPTEIIAIRSAVLHAALASFDPDVLVVDKHPRGLGGELVPALEHLHERGTKIVLGLRDVLDEAAATGRQWREEGNTPALARWYDETWVYGDATVHDVVGELRLPGHLRRRVVHTGYLATGRARERRRTATARPYVLVTVGGGADGAELVRTVTAAALPAGHHAVIVTGPQMPADDVERIRRSVQGRGDVAVHRSVPDAVALMADAAAVVAMGGYNTVCEAMAMRARLLVVPRLQPRREQLVRARALAARGELDVLHPADATPAAIGAWLQVAVNAGPRPDPTVDLDGLARLPGLVAALSRRERADVA